MKKQLMSIGILASVLMISIMAVSFASADDNASVLNSGILHQFNNDRNGNDHDCFKLCVRSTTVIDGTIYQQGGDVNTNYINGANVTVVCNKVTKTTTSGPNGQYEVNFNSHQCGYGDTVTVTAVKGSANGQETGTVSFKYTIGSYQCKTKVNVGIVDVPLVPEFTLAIGALTIVGALGAFLVIRRK